MPEAAFPYDREFPFLAHKVWDALQLNGTFSRIPFVKPFPSLGIKGLAARI
ncbi:hypothetical protein GPX89_07085 [Nocardia sp. ET3-3]|uniref:Uncharacterized protein n=1 Tax=Nocardia terrae TaxID=2675851 RepID=A0A7K1URN5_9NOCA|nr:hypothetical protein [Nocardia terrae]MVU77010.1 hypothetical protein [Nocardia terrae]